VCGNVGRIVQMYCVKYPAMYRDFMLLNKPTTMTSTILSLSTGTSANDCKELSGN
jgi:hypothetical protein